MIKKLLAAVLIALPALGFAQVKFGVVNSQAIAEAMPETKEATTALETASKKYQDEFKNLEEDYNKKYTEAQQMDESTPQVMRERRMKDLQDLAQRIQEFRETATQDLQRQNERLFAPIIQKVQDAITTVGKEGNFTMIFENVVPVYVGTSVVDVNDMVKAKLGLK